MKNKKGFMLAEIVIVSVVIMVGLVSLFTVVSKIFLQYDKRIVYDNVDATYVARGLAEYYVGDYIALLNDGYDFLEYKPSEFEILKRNNGVHAYIVKYKKDIIENFAQVEYNESKIGENFNDYIINYVESNDFTDSSYVNADEDANTYDYVIFAALSDNCDSGVCTEDNGNLSFGNYKFSYDINHVDSEVKKPPIISDLNFEPETRSYGQTYNTNFSVNWFAYHMYNIGIEQLVFKFVNVNDPGANKQITLNKNEFSNNSDFDQNKLGSGNSLEPGIYYLEVYGVDADGISGENFCSLETNNGYCFRSSKKTIGELKYDKSLKETELATISSNSSFYPGASGLKVKFKKGSNTSIYTYTLDNWQIKYADGEVIKSCSSACSYNTTIDFNLKTGKNVDIIITANSSKEKDEDGGGCLAEGTKVLLANGKYKNIEDIDYNDLLTVYDHEFGTISYQYPSWIETPGIDNKYILITFDDNTELKVVKEHGIYSLDYNEYVRINDQEKFKIGSRVVKIKDGKLEEVKVKDIQVIEEEVKYYFMFTNRHFNLITNDILTGSPDVFIYNFHGFNEDLTWKIPLVEKDIYSYEELSEVPYYLYKGMRLYEGKYFNNYGMNKEGYLKFLRSTIINNNRTVKPKLNENRKREWMVTTSEDVVTEENKLSYLMEEGDYYTLKAPKNINGKKFIGWLHTGENIMYQPGDKAEVLYGTHFVAKYQDLFDKYDGSDYFG